MAQSSDEQRREFAQALLETRRQRRQIVQAVNGLLDSWCQANGVTREQLAARAAAKEAAEATLGR